MPSLESDLVDLGSLNLKYLKHLPTLNVGPDVHVLERRAQYPGVLGLGAGSPHCWEAAEKTRAHSHRF